MRAGSQRGFSYLIILFSVAIAAGGLAGTGIVWHTALQREKERELLFIGEQFRRGKLVGDVELAQGRVAEADLGDAEAAEMRADFGQARNHGGGHRL